MAEKKQAFIIKSFKDAGTQEYFEGGSVVPLGAATFANYEFGGLVREATAEEQKPAKPAPTN